MSFTGHDPFTVYWLRPRNDLHSPVTIGEPLHGDEIGFKFTRPKFAPETFTVCKKGSEFIRPTQFGMSLFLVTGLPKIVVKQSPREVSSKVIMICLTGRYVVRCLTKAQQK